MPTRAARNTRLSNRIASTLMTLMGLLWGWQGTTLLVVGEEAMSGIVATPTTVTTAAVLYLLVAVALLAAVVATLRQRRYALTLSITSSLAFVISGFVANGVLFDSSRLPHNIANVVLTAMVVGLMLSAQSKT